MHDVTLVILNSLRIKCHIRRPLKMLSKFIRILRITLCYTQMCGGCLVNMIPVVKLVIHCVLHYYKQNSLAIIIIY